ncbi:small multi-drug export protein [Chengkuizengella axinellae]|uniref:Small multi-drug export protein n=1 Tax=Chengkuizengella axinellae TaxID=3064388 RepID=A0ABT9J427_9BACL|nr:small multi-drug export protein [Chengkuizengella sp. 2205SS18-9]MDP5276338.1 small multi-drug export protein [Chengkuizengella sp. 2205SS18-9]
MNFFEILWPYLLVFIFSAIPLFEAYGVIPIAIVAGLSPIPVVIIGLTGNILTVILLILFIEKVKEWRNKVKKNKKQGVANKRSLRAEKLWKKYGLIGLTIIGPLLVGSHLASFMSLVFGGTKTKTLYWMIASITMWSLLFSILTYFGINIFFTDGAGTLNKYFNK